MSEVFIDNIFVAFGALVCQQTVGIPKCAPPLLAYFFCYCYLYFKQGLLKKNEETFVPSLNFTLHYTDDVISLYNSIFGDFIVKERNLRTEERISIFSLWAFHLIEETWQKHLHMGLYISQLIRYSRDCGSYQDFRLQLTTMLLSRDSWWLSWSHLHRDFINRYRISVSQMTMDTFPLS